MSTALDTVMAQAEEAARTAVPVPIPANQNVAGPVAVSLAKPSMDNFIDGGGMDVDEYIKVKPDGFRIGDSMQGLLEELEVEIDMSEVNPMYSARFETGGNTTFIKSYDGVSTPDGKNFQAEVDRLARQNQKASGIYQTAEIPVTLIDEVEDPKKGSNVKFGEGTRCGITPSVTGFKPFQKFMKQLRATNPDLLQSIVRVKITHQKRTNRNNNEWGVLNFEHIEG